MAIFLSSQTHFLCRTLKVTVIACLSGFYSHTMAAEWDWYPKESLNESQRAALNQYCRGAYLDQWQQNTSTQKSNNIHLFADSISYNAEGKSHLNGNAELQSNALSLTADNMSTTPLNHYTAQGNISLRQQGLLIKGDSITLTDQANANIDQARFVFHPVGIRGEASNIHSKKGVIFIEEGFYTTCEPSSSSWQLYGSAIELNSITGFGTAKHVQIRIDDIPVFYFPWLRFPINDQRHSGFLFPEFGYSDTEGVSLSAPFYLNLAPEYDATLTPHLTEKLGIGIDIEFRHLSPYGTTVFEQSSFSHTDEGEQTTRKVKSTQNITSELSVGLLLEDNPTEGLFPEKNSTSIGEKDHYERSAYVEYNTERFSLNLTNKRYQTPDSSDDQPLEWLPRLSANYYYSNAWFDYQPSLQYTDFFDPEQAEQDGVRQAINQSVTVNVENDWGYLKPGVLSQYRQYDLNSNSAVDSLHHTSTFLDSGLLFERQVTVKGSQWRQTLEPKISYLNAPFTSQSDLPNFDTSEPEISYSNAFSHTRFTGNDRLGDTEQYTLAVESRFYDAHNQERWALKLGQIFYLEDRLISVEGDDRSAIETADKSALLGSVSYKENEQLNLTLDLNYNTEEDLLELGRFSALFSQRNGVRFTTNYLYQVDSDTLGTETKQSQIGGIIPLTDNVHFFYQHDYDWLTDSEIKNVAGFGFENCCIKASASYQRWRDSDDEQNDGFFLRFILRSLGTAGSGNGIKSIENDYWNDGDIGYN